MFLQGTSDFSVIALVLRTDCCIVCKCIHPRMHDSYQITESSRQWRPLWTHDAHNTAATTITTRWKKQEPCEWQFPPRELQTSGGVSLKKIKTPLEPEIIRLRLWTAKTTMTGAKLWTYETFLTHNKSNIKAFTVALRRSSLCVPFVSCAAGQMGLLQQQAPGVLFVFHSLPWPYKLWPSCCGNRFFSRAWLIRLFLSTVCFFLTDFPSSGQKWWVLNVLCDSVRDCSHLFWCAADLHRSVFLFFYRAPG